MYICNENVKILNELPRWESGRNKGKIDRKSMIGMSLNIEYWGGVYKGIEILEYIKDSKPKFLVKYNGNKFKIQCDSFLSGNLGNILSIITREFKVKIGQVFKDEKRYLIILDRKHRVDKKGCDWKYYKYKCNNCGYDEGWMVESSLLIKGIGCSCCANRTAVLGINTIWDTDRWMCDLGVSEEDAKKYTKASNTKINVICPDCGKKKKVVINSIYTNRSIGCTCGDGFSYPEKFMTNVLVQLGVNFQTQLSKKDFSWCENYRYDFYIPSLNMIIETHGIQHYKESSRGRTLQEEQENDVCKKELAVSNSIEHYIELDCSVSNLEWIKNSVLNSKLNKLFDLSKVDWNQCEEFALKNIIKEVCEYWNNKEEWETTKDLSFKFGLDRCTIIRHLKKGGGHGWCSYDTKEEMIRCGITRGKLSGKKVEMFKNNISLGIFESCHELERQSEKLFGVKLLKSAISEVCNGKKTHYKNYTFKYIN